MKKYTHNPQSLKEWNALAKERKRLRMLSIQKVNTFNRYSFIKLVLQHYDGITLL